MSLNKETYVPRGIGERVGRWLLWRLPQNPTATPRQWADYATSERPDEGWTIVDIKLGQRWLKSRGFVEKWRPVGWKDHLSQPYRLTAAGELELERREAATVAWNEDSD